RFSFHSTPCVTARYTLMALADFNSKVTAAPIVYIIVKICSYVHDDQKDTFFIGATASFPVSIIGVSTSTTAVRLSITDILPNDRMCISINGSTADSINITNNKNLLKRKNDSLDNSSMYGI
ncbi:MAG: hypothetical protein ACI4V5_03700, partial [Prevotella sp.]